MLTIFLFKGTSQKRQNLIKNQQSWLLTKLQTKLIPFQSSGIFDLNEGELNISENPPPINKIPLFEWKFNFSEKKGNKINPNDNNIYITDSTKFASKNNSSNIASRKKIPVAIFEE